MSSRFNLSEWALRHRTLVLYFILVFMLAGVFSYTKLGQKEDPDFTFRLMIVKVLWPGATAEDVQNQVLDKIEKKLQETPYLKYIRSYAKPGEAVTFIEVRGDTPPKEIPDIWYKVRRNVGDIRQTLPAGVIGPFFNDEFGDTYGNIYAFTGNGYSMAELRKYVDFARQELLRVPNVKKVDLIGVQTERVTLSFSPTKLAGLGLDPQSLAAQLAQQNGVEPAGFVESGSDRLYLRVTGEYDTLESIRNTPLRAQGKVIRLGDVATVTRGYETPQRFEFRFQGKPGIALAISMAKEGDVLKLGHDLDAGIAQLKRSLPLGVDIEQVSNQPEVVKHSVDEFMESLGEAIAIVLAVSFLSLGLRVGVVVALSIPLVLAMTFVVMYFAGIDLQRISLGALIIALGLLVDDAIIAVEMMALKLEQGWDRVRAATFAYTATAFPMLTGTLITVAGFLPVGLAKSTAGEYTFSIFAVVAIALLLSWLVAVVFTPFLGYKLLPELKHHGEEVDVYQRPFYRRFRSLVTWCLSHRRIVIGVTVIAFLAAGASFKLIQKQFFPTSNRPELMVDLWLPQGATLTSTKQEVLKLEGKLAKNPHLLNYTSYVGSGSPRFYLPLNQEQENANYAQLVLMSKGMEDREALLNQLNDWFAKDFPNVRGRVTRLENGPPVGYPVQFRVMGPNLDKVRSLAEQVATIMRANPNTRNVHLDVNEKARILKLEVDQDKARALGVSTQDLSRSLNLMLTGVPLTQFREGDQTIDVVARLDTATLPKLSGIEDLPVPTGSGQAVPLGQIAKVHVAFEDNTLWHRNRTPVITVRSDIADGWQAPEISDQVEPKVRALEKTFPTGYRIELGGAKESSSEAEDSIKAVMPLMLFCVMTLLMLQLHSFSRMAMVLLTAPLGLIGVALALLVFRQPFGFVANLGVIALAGMIMRNSVILVDQIEQDIRDGAHPWHAIVEATVRRFRPIMLTAAAAILGMIPLVKSIFWGPMAVAIMGGLLVATVLTLLFLPALYAAWFKVKRPEDGPGRLT